MKVLMVTLDSPIHHRKDGIANAVRQLSVSMVGMGHEVTVMGLDATIDKAAHLEEEGVQYWCVPDRGGSVASRMLGMFLYCRGRLAPFCRDHGIEIAHGHGGYVGPIAAADLQAKKVLTMHTSSVEDEFILKDLRDTKQTGKYLMKRLFPPRSFLNMYRSWYFHRVDSIFSVAEHNIEEDIGRLRLPRERFRVVPNGVDYRGIREMGSDAKDRSDESILYFGRVAPIKGIQYLLQALPLVLQEHPKVVLKIVGDGRSLPLLKRQARDLGVESQVEFRGFLTGRPLFEEVARSGIVALPSLYEGCPLTLLESMALGKPIVASDIPGMLEIMRDGVSGLAFRMGDKDDLARKLLSLLDDPSEARRLGEEAERTIRDKYTWEHIAAKTVEGYGSLL